MIVAGETWRDAEDFGKQTATVELRVSDNSESAGVNILGVRDRYAESPEVPGPSLRLQECGNRFP